MKVLARLFVGCAVVAATDPCQAETTGWEPGNETTSRVSPEVRADDELATGDGAYGRFDGDVDVGAHGGVELGDGFSGVLGATAHYYSMAGVFVRGANAFGDEPTRARTMSFGIDLRPAFVPRWALDAQTGRAFWDLTLDSISLELGAYFSDPGSGFGDERGFEASLGFGVPLLGSAQGPWVDARGLLRWSDPTRESTGPDPALVLAFSWHWSLAWR